MYTMNHSDLKCYNNNCSGQTTVDDKSTLNTKYKYNYDVRGFQWNGKAATFEGNAFLGDPATAYSKTKKPVELNKHDVVAKNVL